MRTNYMSSRIDCNGRSALKRIALLSTIAAFQPSIVSAQEKSASAKITDEDIFNFALNLESLETEYYLRGTTGKGMDDADAGSDPGAVTGGNMVPWKDDDLRQFMEEVAANETCARAFLSKNVGQKSCEPSRD